MNCGSRCDRKYLFPQRSKLKLSFLSAKSTSLQFPEILISDLILKKIEKSKFSKKFWPRKKFLIWEMAISIFRTFWILIIIKIKTLIWIYDLTLISICDSMKWKFLKLAHASFQNLIFSKMRGRFQISDLNSDSAYNFASIVVSYEFKKVLTFLFSQELSLKSTNSPPFNLSGICTVNRTLTTMDHG